MRSFLILVWTAAIGIQLTSVEPAMAQTTNWDGVAATFRNYYQQARRLQANVSVPADVERGLAIHRELADAGYAPSMYQLGKAYYYGEGVNIDIAAAAEYFEEAATVGDPNAMVWLGRSLMDLAGNEERAFQVLTEATLAGVPNAGYQLATGHLEERFGAKSDPAAGLELLRELSATGDANAKYELALALRAQDTSGAEAAEARKLFQELTDQNHPRSAERLGEMMVVGEGGPVDYDGAADAFQLALANGRPNAALKLADALLSANRLAEARGALVTATFEGSQEARLRLAIADVTNAFGGASDPSSGSAELEALTNPPTLETADDLARYILDFGVPPQIDLDQVVRTLDEAAVQGDQRAAVRMFMLFRRRPDLFTDSVDRRREALAAYGENLGARSYVEESIRLVGETNFGRQAGVLMAEILDKAEDQDALQRGIFAAFQSDRNAYVYIIQREFAERGLYRGQLSGLADGATIRAIMSYCSTLEIRDLCSSGPLRKDVARAFSRAIAEGV